MYVQFNITLFKCYWQFTNILIKSLGLYYIIFFIVFCSILKQICVLNWSSSTASTTTIAPLTDEAMTSPATTTTTMLSTVQATTSSGTRVSPNVSSEPVNVNALATSPDEGTEAAPSQVSLSGSTCNSQTCQCIQSNIYQF